MYEGYDMADKKDTVQVKNPKTGHYVKIDRANGKIISQKKSDGPYKNIPVARKIKTSWFHIHQLMVKSIQKQVYSDQELVS